MSCSLRNNTTDPVLAYPSHAGPLITCIPIGAPDWWISDRSKDWWKLPASPPPFAGSSRSAAPSSFQISLTVVEHLPRAFYSGLVDFFFLKFMHGLEIYFLEQPIDYHGVWSCRWCFFMWFSWACFSSSMSHWYAEPERSHGSIQNPCLFFSSFSYLRPLTSFFIKKIYNRRRSKAHTNSDLVSLR